MVRRNLLATQRVLLLLLTRACRTTATVSMQVIASKPPLDLEIVKRGITSKLKRNIQVEWGNYLFQPNNDVPIDITQEMNTLQVSLGQECQKRWIEETRGRATFDFIKDVNFAKSRSWFKPSRELVYIITGYGPINSSLYKRGAAEDDSCKYCGEEETVDHIIYSCEIYEDLRKQDVTIS